MYTKSMEDYLEAIYCIIERKGFARTKDIARELEIRPPSVTEMLKKLSNRGLVRYEKYAGVTLTREGEKVARVIKLRHDTLKRFLSILLISDKTANEDACELEHVLKPETIEQLTKFVRFVEKAPMYPRWLEHFKEYCRAGAFECEHCKD